MTGVETIGLAYKLSRELPESLTRRLSAEQLVRLAIAYSRCEWDVSPARWSREQFEAATHDGTVPTFVEFDETDGAR